MNKSELLTFRNVETGDTAFIMSSFLKSLYYGSPWYNAMTKEAFHTEYRRIVEGIVFSPNTVIRVVCLKESPEVIIGYSVTNIPGNVVHFVYVKRDWRKIGLATDLLRGRAKTATHITEAGLAIIKTKGIEFNPFKI